MRINRPHPAPAATEADWLDALARKYRPALNRYFGKRLRQRADVEDLVQEVLVRLAVRGDSRSIEQPESYLMRTATNVWRDYLRKRKTHAADTHEEYQEEHQLREDNDPVNVLQGKESIEALLAALEELPKRTRQVFVLCRIEGMRQKVVAARLGVSVSAVEKHMIKAIAYMTMHLDVL